MSVRNKFIKLILNVYCPNKRCSCIFCLNKKNFPSLSEIPRFRSAILASDNKQFCFSRSVTEEITCLKTCKIQFKMFLEMFFTQHVQMKSVFTCQSTKFLLSTTLESGNPAVTCLIFHSRYKKRQYSNFWEIVDTVLQERRVANAEKENHFHFWRILSTNPNQAHPNLCHKMKKSSHLRHQRVDSPLVDTVDQQFICILI